MAYDHVSSGNEKNEVLIKKKFKPSRRLQLDADKYNGFHEDDQAIKYLFDEYEKQVDDNKYSLEMKQIKTVYPKQKHH